MIRLLRLYTLSESTNLALVAVRTRIGMLFLFRATSLAAGIGLALAFPLIDLVFGGAKDLAFRSFDAFLVGEGLGLAYSLPAAVKAFPLTTIVHVAISLGWIYWLWTYGQPLWRWMWLALPFPAG